MLVEYKFENGIVEIRLNRPEKRNALSSELLGELSEAITKAGRQSGNRLTKLTAAGPVFCAGMDLKEMQERAKLPDAESMMLEDSKRYRDLLVAILKLPMPTLAVVQGPVFAGGVGIVLACDLAMGSSACKFGLPEPKRGIVAAMVTPLLIRRVGIAAASHILLSGETIDADSALRFQMIQQLVEEAGLDEAVKKYSESILTGAPDALAITKRQINNCQGQEIVEQLNEAVQISAEARRGEEAREGLEAFFEKREPNWQDHRD